ncbi:MAG: hypothetical protein ACYC2Y_07785 [Armatimonadota bacterium]
MSELLNKALSHPALVQSFSGVRATFGSGPGISPEHEALVRAYGYAYAKRRSGFLVIGRDPRPTGEAVARALAEGFAAAGVKIIDLGIVTTPIIQTAVRALSAAGGVMVTASHNPLHDNGFKFLSGDAPTGALLSPGEMQAIIEEVRQMIEVPSAEPMIAGNDRHRVRAERAYLDSLGEEWGVEPHCLAPLVYGPVLLDPNGGAACGIGARVLEHFGVRAVEVNSELGYPEHGIDTDGIDPASGKHMLLRVARAAHRQHARLGIAFDYDADRGNLVLPGRDESAIIPPQTVAALNMALALVRCELLGHDHKLAVVVSDATSGASERVAAFFGAEIFTVETGEINVVTRMHELRREGYHVPIGVEGANGGSIFGSATCRDGLQTALCSAMADEHPEIAQRWLSVLGRNHEHVPIGLHLPQILSGVPVNWNRMLRLEGADVCHGEVKERMEHYFETVLWPKLSQTYKEYRFADYEGTSEVSGRSSEATGGWRVILDDAFIFARGSRTEAGVWRLVVDDPNPNRGPALCEAGQAMISAALGA